MTVPHISIYRNAIDAQSKDTIPFDIFLDGIRSGRWQDDVLRVRTTADKDARDLAKKRVPAVTVSGVFAQRNDNGLQSHSGYIVVDIDNVDDINETKSLLCCDPYVYACFVSISGHGLCLIVRIDPKKHREAFQGLSEYFFTKYQVICDPTSINVSRMRFISWDPDLYLNPASNKFTDYPKNKPPKKLDKVLVVQSDFDNIIAQIIQRRFNLCENYHEWLRIGFGLVHEFGERGREYFHLISQFSTKYDPRIADKQYDNCLKGSGSNQVTIATFYHYCKNVGIETHSKQTRQIAQTVKANKKAGLSEDAIKKNLEQFAGVTGVDDIINKVLQTNVGLENEDLLITRVAAWLKSNYIIRRNEITRMIERDGKEMGTKDFNNIWVDAMTVFDKVSFEMVDRLINSDNTVTYNPFIEFIEQNKHRTPEGCIDALFESIETDTGYDVGQFAPDHAVYFGKKWLVSMIASIYGEHSPLMLTLCGVVQNTGKTEFFRRLLPTELKKYYAESKLDNEKDDAILMTKKLLIVDDEFAGKSKKEESHLKSITSRDTITVREPYGRASVDLRRIAVLGGTSNELAILTDNTGNRRKLPINVLSIDHDKYNAVDKTDLFIEAYHLYQQGFNWRVSGQDIIRLKNNTAQFEAISMEYELLQAYFECPTPQAEGFGVTFMTTSQIKAYMETASRQHTNVNRIGQEMRKMGWEVKSKRVNDNPVKGYYVIIRGSHQAQTADKPF